MISERARHRGRRLLIFLSRLASPLLPLPAATTTERGDGVRGAIEVDRSALHVEGAGVMVAVAAKSPCDLAGVGIDGEG